MTVVHDAGEVLVGINIRDVTNDPARAIDTVTGLPVRASLMGAITDRIASQPGEPFAVLKVKCVASTR